MAQTALFVRRATSATVRIARPAGAGQDRSRVGERVARLFCDAGSGRGFQAEVADRGRPGFDVAQLVPGRWPVGREGDQPEQAAELGVNDHVGGEEQQGRR